jgi:hypothetical protein
MRVRPEWAVSQLWLFVSGCGTGVKKNVFDVKRMIYLLVVALLIGLALVHFRTLHKRVVYQVASMREEEQQIRQEMWRQQGQLSMMLERPGRIRERVEYYGLALCPPGEEKPMVAKEKLAKNDDGVVAN